MKEVKVLVVQSCSTLCHHMNYIAHQAPLSTGFSRQEYWSGSPFPSPGDLPNPGMDPRSPTLQADSLPAELPGKLITVIQTKLQITTLKSLKGEIKLKIRI